MITRQRRLDIYLTDGTHEKIDYSIFAQMTDWCEWTRVGSEAVVDWLIPEGMIEVTPFSKLCNLYEKRYKKLVWENPPLEIPLSELRLPEYEYLEDDEFFEESDVFPEFLQFLDDD